MVPDAGVIHQHEKEPQTAACVCSWGRKWGKGIERMWVCECACEHKCVSCLCAWVLEWTRVICPELYFHCTPSSTLQGRDMILSLSCRAGTPQTQTWRAYICPVQQALPEPTRHGWAQCRLLTKGGVLLLWSDCRFPTDHYKTWEGQQILAETNSANVSKMTWAQAPKTECCKWL